MKQIVVGIDDGHGMRDPTNTKENPGKRTPLFPDGHYILENVFNRGVSNHFEKACKRHRLTALQLAPEDFNVTLDERVRRAKAWGCDIIVSWHFNYWSPDGDGHWYDGADGISTHYQKGAKDAEKLAICVQKYLIQGTKQRDRGVKPDDLQICRETKGTAILIESGFMNSIAEAKLMDQEWYWKEQAEQAMQGLCEYLGIKYIPEEVEDMPKIVIVPKGPGDFPAAQQLAMKYHYPLVTADDIRDAETPVQIGGGEDVKPGCKKIFGADRDKTFEAVVAALKGGI